MNELAPKDAWDQDAELDRLDGKEATGIAPDCDDDFAVSEEMDGDSQWLDCWSEEEFVDDDPITEEEAMELARRFAGGW